MSDWHDIATAPKDGTVIELYFPAGKSYVRNGERHSVDLDARVVRGRWWTAEYARERVGKKKSATGARGALIAANGGYWGSAGLHSKPMSGHPTHWRAPLPQRAGGRTG
jgi:hypothetical protein